MNTYGRHLLVEYYDCDKSILNNLEAIEALFIAAARAADATIVQSTFHRFAPQGVSGVVVIEESHLSIHTWPEHGYAAVDLFYCGGTVKVHKAVDVLRERFKPERIKFLVVRRGLQGEVER